MCCCRHRYKKYEWYREKVFVSGGKTETELETLIWAKEAEKLGAGEILLTSMNADGTKTDSLDITQQIAQLVNIPVIASGGAGKMEDFKEVLKNQGQWCFSC